jgi:hypothetical protein
MYRLPESSKSKSLACVLGAIFLTANGPARAVDNSHNPALPQYEVAGTELMLHNRLLAEGLGDPVRNARAAIASCDDEKWAQAKSRLDAVHTTANRAHIGTATGIIEDSATEDLDAINDLTSNLQSQWIEKCYNKQTNRSDTSFTAGGSLSVGQLSLPQQGYLGFEALGTLVQTLNVATVEEDARATAGSFDGSAHFSNTSILGSNGIWTGVGYIRTTANASTRLINIDPAGSRLLLPGPLGGASGFSLVSAGGLNVVTQADYEAQYEWDAFYAKAGLPFDCGPWLLMPFFGVAYTDQEQTSRFSGSIPGFGRNFAYNTMVDVETISPLAGFDAVRHFEAFSVHGGGLLSADFNDAHGYDRLSFTGVADSQAMLNQDDTSLGGRAWAGVTFGTPRSPFKLSLDASYVYVDNIPVVNRDGTNPSSLGFESADGILGTIRATFRF